MTKIIIVAAMNQDSVIGVDNQLPWHIEEDLRHFKQITIGLPIIMGRKTFESIGRILPGRKNIVVTRNKDFDYPQVTIYSDLDLAIKDQQEYAAICIIGGGDIFTQALPIAHELYLTVIDIKVDKPTVFFPQLDFKKWKLMDTKEIISHQQKIKCTFNHYSNINLLI